MERMERQIKENSKEIAELRQERRETNGHILELQKDVIIIKGDFKHTDFTYKSLDNQLNAIRKEFKADKNDTKRRLDAETKKELDRYEYQERSASSRWWGLLFTIIGGFVLMYFTM